ncbi:hypothetical protein EW145_g3465 [Phellinidium pouzarii]|uniref:SH3 domain-containing protein n=1 Tax=Phellinidium pouzarii TaxID=167371 RepID=A0A4V3XCV5_9AGAM|nr:hypothetical protein EW145_g3465 [Phellinidium pouzarii]
MAPHGELRRSLGTSSSGSGNIPTVAVVGFCVAGAGLLAVAIWGTIFVYRRRARRAREAKRNSTFLTVKGVLKESSLEIKRTNFSRANITASVVMPDKAVMRPDASRDKILNYYKDQGTMPRPFPPFSFSLNVVHNPSRMSSLSPATKSEPKDNRVSTLSFSASAARLPSPSASLVKSSHPRISISGSVRDSIRESFFGASDRPRSTFSLSGGSRLSVLSQNSSLRSSGMQQRAVRQLFTPILPDELMLSLGERVSVLRSFEDGWCIVARPQPYGALGESELGAVPAWCFIKLLKGLHSERPVRSISLGVTVQIDDQDRSRDDIISWSNF